MECCSKWTRSWHCRQGWYYYVVLPQKSCQPDTKFNSKSVKLSQISSKNKLQMSILWLLYKSFTFTKCSRSTKRPKISSSLDKCSCCFLCSGCWGVGVKNQMSDGTTVGDHIYYAAWKLWVTAERLEVAVLRSLVSQVCAERGDRCHLTCTSLPMAQLSRPCQADSPAWAGGYWHEELPSDFAIAKGFEFWWILPLCHLMLPNISFLPLVFFFLTLLADAQHKWNRRCIFKSTATHQQQRADAFLSW